MGDWYKERSDLLAEVRSISRQKELQRSLCPPGQLSDVCLGQSRSVILNNQPVPVSSSWPTIAISPSSTTSSSRLLFLSKLTEIIRYVYQKNNR